MQPHERGPGGTSLVRRGAGATVLALLAAAASAQDANYWNIQYGSVGQLLGGQVIGSSRDLSTTYYNPGGLALLEDEAFLLSTESFQIENLTSKPAEGSRGLDLSSTHIGTFPTLVAGRLPRSWLGSRTRMAWSYLTRQKLDVRLAERLVDPLDLPQGRSSLEQYVDQRVTEGWGGLTLAYPVSENLGIGVTVYGIYRGQSSRRELSVQALAPARDPLTGLAVQDFSYSHFRTLAKLGVAWQRRNLQLGLNVTSPSLSILGRGKAGYTVSAVGTDVDDDGLADPPVLESAAAESLSAHYKSSWAIGGGLGWKHGRSRWQATVEWFAPVGRYSVVDLPGAEGPSQSNLTQALRSVVNVGLGIEHGFESGVAVYGAALTDFTAASGDPSVNATVTNWNLYHVSGGAKFSVVGSRFTLGATFSFGGSRRTSGYLPVAIEALPGEKVTTDVNVRYRRLVVLLGFLFGD